MQMKSYAQECLTAEEHAFIRACVDHMVPDDEHSPSGTDLGVDVYISRALAGDWGQGLRMYRQGPWARGTSSQGYQSSLTPMQFVRAGIHATNSYCLGVHGRRFDELPSEVCEEVLQAMAHEAFEFDQELAPNEFLDLLHQLVMEGFFADPVHGGNRHMASWRMLGFPGAVARYASRIVVFKDKAFPHEPAGIQDHKECDSDA